MLPSCFTFQNTINVYRYALHCRAFLFCIIITFRAFFYIIITFVATILPEVFKTLSLFYSPCCELYYLLNSSFLQVAVRLQKELDETNAKLKAKEEASNKEATKKKAPMLGTIGKVSSGEVSRRSSKFFNCH